MSGSISGEGECSFLIIAFSTSVKSPQVIRFTKPLSYIVLISDISSVASMSMRSLTIRPLSIASVSVAEGKSLLMAVSNSLNQAMTSVLLSGSKKEI